MAGNFLLDRLKEKFGGDRDYSDGFDNLNYKVGNTSGMDVTQQIPSDLAERVGYAAQRGGGEMEVQIANPTSFYLDRENLYSVIDGLGIDASIHSDPNIGYTSLAKQQFDQTHDYFNKYLQAHTSFDQERENRGLNFRLGRINPHISVSPLPPVEQGRPQGVALDPFGYSLTQVQKEDMDQRRREGKNIYDNEEFLRRFYRLFILDEIGDREYRQFEQLYTPFSEKIDREWRESQNKILNRIWDERTGRYEDKIEDKAALLAGASQADPAISNIWLGIIDDKDVETVEITEEEVLVPNPLGEQDGQPRFMPPENISSLRDFNKFIENFRVQRSLTSLGTLPEIIYYFSSDDAKLSDFAERKKVSIEDPSVKDKIWEAVKGPLQEAMNDLWSADPGEKRDSDLEENEPRVSLIPIQNKRQAIQRQMEIQQDKIWEKAYENDIDDLRDEVENMFGGEEGYFTNGDDRSEQERHENFLRFVIDRVVSRQMETESNAFYRIFPAWMSCCNEDYAAEVDGGEVVSHDGWKAPKFLWESLVEKHSDDWDIDLKNPRQENGYFEALENDKEFQMDVAAAVSGVVMWTHFTQIKNNFDMDSQSFNGEEVVEADSGRYTWIEWMNKYGIGINMEDMAGQPQQVFRLWRPFHIVAACRAVNITAREELGEVDESLDDCPVKFTIDMEHVGSFGVDAWKEMEILINWEKEILKDPPVVDELPGDSDKPLAKMVRMYHLTRPGHETTQGVGHLHGPFRKGDTELYEWLYKMVENGFAQGEERASVMYELGGEMTGTVQQAKLSMDLIELGVSPEDLDPARVDPGEEYQDEEEALIARFFGIDNSKYSREWAKIEEHAFDPLADLMEAEPFENTFSGGKAVEDRKLQEWSKEEYQ